MPKYPQNDAEEKEVHNWFTYHAPKVDQIERFSKIREKARDLAFVLLEEVPPCADRTVALRKLRECIMMANAAIACNE